MNKKKGFTHCIIALLISTNLFAQENNGIDTSVQEIVVVFKSHFDIGYTHLASEVVHGYQTTTIDNALKVVDANKNLPREQQFVWTIPGWPMKKIMEDWPGQNAERKSKIEQAFLDGRFAVHALPFTMQTEMQAPEALVRGLEFSSAIARKANKPIPTSAKMTDVPEHSWIMPTLLKQAGVRFLHLGCNPGSTPPDVPVLFWWQGPDGSRVLTMYSRLYGSAIFPPADWHHKTWLAMMMRGDNAGPPSPEEVKNIMTEIRKKLPNVKITVGQLDDFADRILKEDLSLPVVASDMPDTWIHGIMCDPAGVKLSRQTLPALFMTEALNTTLQHNGVAVKNISQPIADSYENSLLYYEHTWGGSMGWIADYLQTKDYMGQVSDWNYGKKWKQDLDAGRFKRSIASWEEHSGYARTANSLALPLLGEQMQLLANSVNASGKRTVIYNPLPWPRNGIPSMGYKTFSGNQLPSSGKAPVINAEKYTLENKYFKITADPSKGCISSIVDKTTGKELVDNKAAQGFGQFLYERMSANEVREYDSSYVRKGSDNWAYIEIGKPNMPSASEFPYKSFMNGKSTVRVAKDGNNASLILDYLPQSGKLNFPVSLKIGLDGDSKYINMDITVDKPADPWPEDGWICFPFNIQQPQYRIGRNGSVIDPVKDINVSGVNRYMYAVESGVAIFGQDQEGAGICSMDAPLVSVGVPGDWKFDNTYVPTKPVFYFNLFNNHWSTNYRFWNDGKWNYRFKIWGFSKYNTAESLTEPAFESRYPLQRATADGAAGNLPLEKTGIQLSRKGILVTAFGKDPDGNAGTLLRLWEQSGTSGKLTVTIPSELNAKTATPVNLRGEKTGNAIPVSSNKFECTLNGFAPASFILE
ncbi:glycoside hydrolase family 38 C-terminal domain-containing protein [Danxiaibacter flavus]|uniref:Glycoside hydrolase family 38 C-terminal domain-containing protein n=1 Tax=Danxiaibacter flavus TaxID=3049108 RepID=A0ABV3ZFY4_9BACT|nr:glycoside hydrolase family 38 C-terminal domain-containing protein [Chitinophagaceae bacterium DXS]